MGGGTRRTVTAVFVDVVGSTSIAEQMDPEAFAGLMSRFFSEMSSVVERHGGVVEKFIGDAVKASFGIPVAHEDDALRAVRAAVEMRAEVAVLNEELRARWGIDLQTRTGINTGEVMSVTHGDHAVALGDAMNVAARLEQTAAPNQIVIGPTTYELVQHAVDARPLAPLTLKGKGHEVVAYAVETLDPEVQAIRRHLDRPMIGRDSDVLAVEAVFEEARGTPGCSLVMVVGEPGIGKSRLLAEVKTRLQRRGALFLIGACVPYGEAATYAPIAEAITTWFASSQNEERDIRTALESTVAAEADSEVIADRIFQLMGLEEASAPPEELFWGLRKLLEAIGREHPLVIAIEDLHWAERSLVGLLDHVVEWTRDAAVVLICSCRPEFLDLHPHWERKARMTLRLAPLPQEEARALVRGISSPALDPERADEVVAVSGGNPLFIEQLASLLDDPDTAAGGPGGARPLRLPPSIQALMAARLDMLTEAEREVLETAAVVGAEFSARAVGQIVPRDHVTHVFEVLDALIAKNLVHAGRWDSVSGPVFTFRHALIREAAYDALPREERAERHERLATWLQELAPAAPLEVIGYHYEQAYKALEDIGSAARGGEFARRAAGFLQEAGVAAHRRHDMATAGDLLWRAWLLLKSQGVSPFDLAMLLEDAVVEELDMERLKQLERDFEAVAAGGDLRFVAAGLICTAIRRLRTDTTYTVEEARKVVPRAIEIYEETGAIEGLLRAYISQVFLHLIRGESSAQVDAAQHLIAVARTQNDGYWETWGHRELARAVVEGPMAVGAALSIVHQFVAVAERNQDRVMRARALLEVATLKAMLGQSEAVKVFEEARATLEDLGLLVPLAAGAYPVLVAFDQLAEAELLLRLSSETLAKKGIISIHASMAARLADVLYRRERLSEASKSLDEARSSTSDDDPDAVIMCGVVQAKLAAARNDYDLALATIRESLNVVAATEWLPFHAEVELTAAEILRKAGQQAKALELATSAQQRYERKGHRAGVKRAKAFLEQV